MAKQNKTVVKTFGKQQVEFRLKLIEKILSDISYDKMTIDGMKTKAKLLHERSILISTLAKMD